MESRNTISEASIEAYFRTQCKKMGIKTVKMVPIYEAGIPDRQVLFRGVSGFCELKRPGKKAKPHQIAYLKELHKAGFYTGVVDSKESAKEWLEGFLEHVKNILKDE